MGMYRVQYHMRLGASGWRYVFYKEANSASELVTSLIDQTQTAPLLGVHTPQVVLQAISAARVPAPGDANFQRDTFRRDLSNQAMHGSELPDVTQTCALLQFRGAGVARPLYLRGLIDEWVQRSQVGQSTPAQGMNGPLTSFIQWAIENDFAIQKQNPPTSLGFEWKNVSTISAEENSNNVNSVVTMRSPHGWTVGQQIMFNNKADCEIAGFNGMHVIQDVPADPTPATKVVLNVRYRPQVATYFPVNLRARAVGYNYIDITEGYFVRFTSRDTGRPETSRGRAPSRSCRH